MKCEVCGKGVFDGVKLHRVNKKGVPGIWRCSRHLTEEQDFQVDPEVRKLTNIIQRGGK
jgi:hypothetical protein